ncbi:MAG: response regulator [Pseudanabaenaceae cyanobacterium bins.68]|nr:response regulator [Pseudanabaenaceae cyanobacterium bins.68]
MKQVLVVEDGNAEQQLMSSLLTKSGLEVIAHSNAEDAWKWLQVNGCPNLVVLDIIMPGESGLDLCRHIRQQNKFKDLPIVFCSSKSQEFDRFWALRQGGNAYITKPFAPKELIDTVYKYLS